MNVFSRPAFLRRKDAPKGADGKKASPVKPKFVKRSLPGGSAQPRGVDLCGCMLTFLLVLGIALITLQNQRPRSWGDEGDRLKNLILTNAEKPFHMISESLPESVTDSLYSLSNQVHSLTDSVSALTGVGGDAATDTDTPNRMILPKPPVTGIPPTFYREAPLNATIGSVQETRPMFDAIFSSASPDSDSRVEVDMRWSERDKSIKVCRFRNACITTKGYLVLDDQSLEKVRAAGMDLTHCGVTAVTPRRKQTYSIAPFDVFNISVSDAHMAHLVLEALPVLYAHDMHFGDAFGLQRNDLQRWSSADSEEHDVARRQPALLVSSRVLKPSIFSWVGQFLSALVPGQPYIFATKSLFSRANANKDAVCFHSIFTFPHKHFSLRNPAWYDSNATFYTHNGLTRDPVVPEDPTSGDESSTADGADDRTSETVSARKARKVVSVSIVNRLESKGRSLVKATDLRDRLLQRFNHSDSDARLTVRVRHLEKMTFAKQVALMQFSHIVVSPHGAGLSNVVFTRVGTRVVEVLPFLFYASGFERVSRAFSLNYTSVKAEPDRERFFDCVRRTDSPRLAAFARMSWDYATQRTNGWGSKVRGSEIDQVALVTDLAKVSNKYKGIEKLRVCAREQRLRIQMEEMEEKISAMVKDVVE